METHIPANPPRLGPYKNFKFRIVFDGRVVAGISKVSGLKRTTEVVKHREGGDPSTARAMPGQTEYEAITLERGVTHDSEFYQWVNKVWEFPNSTTIDDTTSLTNHRKDIVIELYNEAGQKVLSYTVHKCWSSLFTGLPDLDANSKAVSIQELVLENEGWKTEYPQEAEQQTLPPS